LACCNTGIRVVEELSELVKFAKRSVIGLEGYEESDAKSSR
jgi:hypothetical protein